jgi:hypothetical protein
MMKQRSRMVVSDIHAVSDAESMLTLVLMKAHGAADMVGCNMVY